MSNEPDAPEPQGVTYSVVGADGGTYGPVDFETLKSWVADGRVIATTMLINEQTKVRMQARYIPGLIEESASSPPPVQHAQSYAEQPEQKKGTPVWAIVCIVALLGCGGVVVILAAILFPVFSQAKHSAQRTHALSNLKQVSMGILMYATDFDEKYPLQMDSARTFGPAVDAYVKNRNLFVSVNPKGGEILGNKRLSGKGMDKLKRPAQTILIFDSLPWPNDKAVVAYTDGHANSHNPYSVAMQQLQVDPFR